MGGYSKIKDTNTPTINDPKSPSKPEVSDLSPDPNKAPEQTQEDPKKQEDSEKKRSCLDAVEDGKRKLRRNFSTTSSRFMRLDRQNSSSINVGSRALQGALRRAFSVRSSSSDKYSRIYSDRHAALESPFEEDGDDEEDTKAGSGKKDPKEKKNKRSRILRACKRILEVRREELLEQAAQNQGSCS
ncbi:hypothetical protein V2J09_002298 [Rumex salicifolius]